MSKHVPPSALPGVVVAADALACVRGGSPVFKGVRFSAGPGDLVAVRGPNGAGKSSLLRILAGLLSPQAGRLSLSVDGIAADGDRRAGIAHYLGHLDGLKASLTLRENLAFWRRLYPPHSALGPAQTIDEATALTGVSHLGPLPVAVLSAGQRRRAAISRLLLSPRPLWLLDEPMAALDAPGEAMLGRLIEDQLARGGTVIAATHQALPVTPRRVTTLALADPA